MILWNTVYVIYHMIYYINSIYIYSFIRCTFIIIIYLLIYYTLTFTVTYITLKCTYNHKIMVIFFILEQINLYLFVNEM